MSRAIDPARACLPVRDWPAADQLLWRRAVESDPFESDEETHAAWRPTTTQTNREGYGRWINHLSRSGCDLLLTPAERVTPVQLKTYLTELRAQGLAPQTRSNRISQLLSVMLVFAPDRDWDWLRKRFTRTEAVAKESRKPQSLDFLSGDILDRAIKNMNRVRTNCRELNVLAALEYRNWLMLAMLTLTPLRRNNFVNLSIGLDLMWRDEQWAVEIAPARTKQKKRIRMPVPCVLNIPLGFYLEAARPVLMSSKTTNRLWLTVRQTPMTPHSAYIAITNFTRQVFGKSINPHRLRHISCTSTVVADPEQTEAARALLTHSDKRVTEERYVIASSLAASRQQAELIAKMRKRFVFPI